jgi:hypothetical protein
MMGKRLVVLALRSVQATELVQQDNELGALLRVEQHQRVLESLASFGPRARLAQQVAELKLDQSAVMMVFTEHLDGRRQRAPTRTDRTVEVTGSLIETRDRGEGHACGCMVAFSLGDGQGVLEV